MSSTDTNQASEGELKILLESNGWKFYEELNGFRKESKYTIPMFSTDQKTNYDELSAGNYYELKQVIQSAIRTEKLKLLAEVREQTTIFKIKAHDKKGQPHLYEAGRGVPPEVLDKLEAEL